MTRLDAHSSPEGAERQAALAVVVSRALWLVEHTRTFGRDADLVQLVELDAALRSAVMRVIRCPVYEVATQTIALPAALARLGPEVLTDVFRSAAPPGDPPGPDAIASRCRHWLHGIAAGAAARWLSNQGEHDDPEQAYVAALAHGLCRGFDSGRTSSVSGDITPESLPGFGPRTDPIVRLDRLFGRPATEAELAADAPTADEASRRLSRVVLRADALACALGFGPVDAKARISVDEDHVAPVGEAIHLELAHAAGLLGLRPAGMDDLVRELALREARAVADGFFERSPQVHRPPHVLRLSSAHDELIDLRSLATIDEILERGVTVIHRDLGFERIVVVEREHGNPEAARVRAVACRTRLTGPAPRTLVEVPLTAGGSLLDALDGGRAHASSPGADADVLRFLRTRSFAAAPLRAGTSAVGAILADHFLSGRDVAPDEIAALGIAASALGLVIESAAITAEGKTLRALAEKDALTGINNRRNVLEILRREIDRARRYGKPLSVALIDVDHFKSWNDLHGHQVGDTVLQAVAQIISSTGREIDACGRYGGEEFLVVLPETTAEHAMLYAERLRMTIESHGNDLAATYPNSALTASIGVTQLLTRGDDADRMIQRADRALYAAKDHGRNRVCVEATPRSDPVLPAPVVRGILDDL